MDLPKTSTPLARYHQEIAAGLLSPDPAQRMAVEHTDALYHALVAQAQSPTKGWWWALPGFGKSGNAVRGLYFWGGVGRGKTHIVNGFFECLPFAGKLRIHFHSFMQRVHEELKTLREREDPLLEVARRLAGQVRVLCLDEFHVTDITDAMILSRLLSALFDEGVTLVTTSNIAPKDLYREGLQRERFLPAIALLEERTRVVHLDAALDYRLRTLERAEIYHYPLDAAAEEILAKCYEELRCADELDAEAISVQARQILVRGVCDGVAWFDFHELCETPRSVADYITIARRFHTVMLSGVPILDDQRQDPLVRFIHLIDELYDRNVNLIVSAAASPAKLYAGHRHELKFARTRSRLQEMRSREYLARPHIA